MRAGQTGTREVLLLDHDDEDDNDDAGPLEEIEHRGRTYRVIGTLKARWYTVHASRDGHRVVVSHLTLGMVSILGDAPLGKGQKAQGKSRVETAKRADSDGTLQGFFCWCLSIARLMLAPSACPWSKRKGTLPKVA